MQVENKPILRISMLLTSLELNLKMSKSQIMKTRYLIMETKMITFRVTLKILVSMKNRNNEFIMIQKAGKKLKTKNLKCLLKNFKKSLIKLR